MTSSLLRVQVVGHGRRLDVCLPAHVPVWEFLPEVLRGLGGTSDAAQSCLVTAAGVRLEFAEDLGRQGVRQGDVLTVAPAAAHTPPELHDDLVQAAHARARVVVEEWTGEAARHTAYALGCGAVAAALMVLARGPSPGPGAILFATLCLPALVALGVTAHREGAPTWWRVAVGWLAPGAAWVLGSALAPSGAAWGGYVSPAMVAVVGVLLVVTGGRDAPLYAPPPLAAAVWTAAALLGEQIQVPPWQVVLVALVVGVLVSGVVPGAVVELTVTRGQSALQTHVDLDRLDADLVLAHRIVLAWSLTGTLTLLCVVPYAVHAGAAATTAVLLVVLVRWLRTRRQRSWALSLAGVGGAALSLGWVGFLVSAVRADWTPAVVVVAACLAAVAVVMSSTASNGGSSPWRDWCADVLEVVAVVCLPLAVTAALWWSTGWSTGWSGWSPW